MLQLYVNGGHVLLDYSALVDGLNLYQNLKRALIR